MYQSVLTIPKVTAEDIANLHRDYPFAKNTEFEIVDSAEVAQQQAKKIFNQTSYRYEYVAAVLKTVEDVKTKSYRITLQIAGD